MNRHQITDLGALERAVLEILWQSGHASADSVQKALARPLKESTVRTVLKRLEAKGLVTHTVEQRTYITAVPTLIEQNQLVGGLGAFRHLDGSRKQRIQRGLLELVEAQNL